MKKSILLIFLLALAACGGGENTQLKAQLAGKWAKMYTKDPVAWVFKSDGTVEKVEADFDGDKSLGKGTFVTKGNTVVVTWSGNSSAETLDASFDEKGDLKLNSAASGPMSFHKVK